MMENLIKQIDELMTSIKNDTNKTQLPDLGERLKELSKILGKSKQEYVRLKVEKEYLEPQLKEQIRKEFEIEQDRLEIELTEEQIKKYKRAKITVDEVDMKMKLDERYIENMKSKGEQEGIIAYLDPLVRSYYEWVQMVKFASNLDIRFSNNYKDEYEKDK